MSANLDAVPDVSCRSPKHVVDMKRLMRVIRIIDRWELAVTRYEGQDTEFLQAIAEVLK